MAEGSPPEPGEPRQAADWLRAHGVTLGAVALIAAQLWWKAILLAHSYFRQDDYQYLGRALDSGLGWKYLMQVDDGHLAPIGMVLNWALARISLFSWPLTCAVILPLLAAACFAMLRMLRTVFGNRPAILIPLGLFLFSPLSLAAADWWAVAFEILPLQIAMFMAIDAHVRYLRDGRTRTAVTAVIWLAVGLASSDKGAVVPLLLFALTAAFFVTEPRTHWVKAIARAAARYRRAWLWYGGLLTGYLILYFVQLSGSSIQPSSPGPASRLASLTVTMFEKNLVPGALGGPWQWWAGGLGYAQAGPPAQLVQLAWAVAIVVVIASCVCRVGAWRAWAIVIGWVVAADLVPVAFGRLQVFPATLLGVQTRYVTDATGVLALCAGLAFLPVAGERDAYRLRAGTLGVRVQVRAVVAVLAALFLAGAAVSLQGLESVTAASVTQARSYIATMRLAVTRAPRGATIVAGATPAFIMDPGLFWLQGYTSKVADPIAQTEPPRRLTFTATPLGQAGQLMIFNARGQLLSAAVGGPSSWPPPPGQKCWPVTIAATSIPLNGTLYRWPWMVRLAYSGPAGRLAVSFGGTLSTVWLPAGKGVVYVPVTGAGDSVILQLADGSASGASTCVTQLTVGSIQPVPASRPIPAAPRPG
ncbi:MAG TPA: hypothetical protein VG123_37240 [Streptosporangiaceae bacterium]|nr:hypothetical protein [Streptosporangiaceae bacterium]